MIPEVLAPLGLEPTMVISSGHGFWFLWKLSSMKGSAWLESTNQELAGLLGGDACHDRTRICRIPGSINTKRGDERLVSVAEMHPDRIYPPSAFLTVQRRRKGARRSPDLSSIAISDDDRIPGVVRQEMNWRLRPDLQAYVDGSAASVDRSKTECQIACSLARMGWTRGEIRAFFREHALPRFCEDQQHGRPYVFDRMISRVIFEWAPSWDLSASPPEPPSVSKRNGQHLTRPRDMATVSCRRFALVEAARGQGRSDLIGEVSDWLGISPHTIEKDLKALLRSGALIKAKDPSDASNRRILVHPNQRVLELGRARGPECLSLFRYLQPGRIYPVKRLTELPGEGGLSHGA